jgi:hypothetical protein
VLVKERLRIGGADLQVVDALHVRDVGTKTSIGQRSILSEGLCLEVGCKVGEGICTRIR